MTEALNLLASVKTHGGVDKSAKVFDLMKGMSETFEDTLGKLKEGKKREKPKQKAVEAYWDKGEAKNYFEKTPLESGLSMSMENSSQEGSQVKALGEFSKENADKGLLESEKSLLKLAKAVKLGSAELAQEANEQIEKITQVANPLLNANVAVSAQNLSSQTIIPKVAAISSTNASSQALAAKSQSNSEKATAARSKLELPKQGLKEAQEKLELLKEKVVEQVRLQLKFMAKDGIGEVKLRLHPKFLGLVDVHLNIDGAMTEATLRVQNQSTKDLLDRSIEELRKSLEENGLMASSIEIIYDGESSNYGQTEQHSLEDEKTKRQWVTSFMPLERSVGPNLANEAENEEAGDHVVNVMA